MNDCNCIIATTLVPLTQGKYAIIDNEDADEIMQYKWHLGNRGYAVRTTPRPSGKRLTVQMSRQLLGLEPGDKIEADHINHNPLDNRRCNLRIATKEQNGMNRLSSNRNAKTKSKGVWLRTDRRKKPWRAKIGTKHLGCYATEQEAADAYDAAARKHFGEFAYTNEQARKGYPVAV